MENYPKYYRKAIKGVVGGRMLGRKGEEFEFLLPAGDPKTMDEDSITITINSKEEEDYLKKYNKPTIVKGILIEVSEYEMKLDSINAVSDGELKDILKLPFRQMQKKVLEFTSQVPVSRLLELAKSENKQIKTIQFIEQSLTELMDKPANITSITDDNIKATSV